jgi:hypothetical protein
MIGKKTAKMNIFEKYDFLKINGFNVDLKFTKEKVIIIDLQHNNEPLCQEECHA